MFIKGLDNGYLYTKDNEKRIFKSAFSKEETAMTGKSYITIDGITYCVGVGNTIVDLNKVGSETNKVCTLMNLAMTGSNDYCLVIGLPIGQFRDQRNEFRNEVLLYNDYNVIYQEQQMNFDIKDVLVFPQGAAALLNEDNLSDGDFIVVDIGGLSIDIGYIEIVNGCPIMHKYDTYFDGMQKLYSSIIYEVNNKYNMTLETQYAEKILTRGLFVDGEKQDISFLNESKEKFISSVIKDLKLNYPSRTTPIYLVGGGANTMDDIIASYFKNTVLTPNSQFANACGFHKMGLKKFKKYITLPSDNIINWRINNG